jgi:hypothetical protein
MFVEGDITPHNPLCKYSDMHAYVYFDMLETHGDWPALRFSLAENSHVIYRKGGCVLRGVLAPETRPLSDPK